MPASEEVEIVLPKQVTEIPSIEQQLIKQLPQKYQKMPGLPEELLKRLGDIPKDQLKPGGKVTFSINHQQISSPYPPPVILDGLERHCTGSTDRIISMVENQQKLQSDLNKAQIRKINTDADILKNESATSSCQLGVSHLFFYLFELGYRLFLLQTALKDTFLIAFSASKFVTTRPFASLKNSASLFFKASLFESGFGLMRGKPLKFHSFRRAPSVPPLDRVRRRPGAISFFFLLHSRQLGQLGQLGVQLGPSSVPARSPARGQPLVFLSF